MPLFTTTSRFAGRLDFLRGRPQPVAWRFAARDEDTDRRLRLPDAHRWRGRRAQRRLACYISAGGMKDLRPAPTADRDERRRRAIVALALGTLAFWLLFFFVPCA